MRHTRLLLALTVPVTCLALAAPALAAPATDAHTDALLTKRLANPRLGSDFAMLVVDAATGDIISDHGSGNAQLPASTMKIITAVSTLANISPDHRFATRVRQGATTQAGTEVILEGGGDPLLSRTQLQNLARTTAKTLRAAHETSGAQGKPHAVVRVDRRLFPDTGRAPGWTTGYIPSVAAPVQALAQLGAYSADPSQQAASTFAGYLRAAGVKARIGDRVADGASGDSPVLAEDTSHTVGDAIKHMLSISENNVAEVLHRHVALARGITPDWAGAQEATEATLTELGLDPSGQRLDDGSGLSRKDRVTPRFLVDVLRTARVTHPQKFALIFDDNAMPVAGRTGTLDDAYGRFVTKHAKCAQGMARGKTGTLSDTISLAGVTSTVDGQERIYTMLINHRPTAYSALSQRQVLDGLVATIAGCWD